MQTQKTRSDRLLSVDVIRVLATLMIVAIHTIFNFTVRADFLNTKLWFLLEPIVALSKSGVLLFFMLSGYLVIHKNRTLKDNLQKTWKRIFVPLFAFSIIYLIFDVITFHLTPTNAAGFWQSKFIQTVSFPTTSLWFLVVLFSLYLLNPVWQLIFSKKENAPIAIYVTNLAFLVSILGAFLKLPMLKVDTALTIFTGWIGFVFFYLYGGLIYNKWIVVNKKKMNVILVCVGVVTTIVGDYLTTFTDLYRIKFFFAGYFGDVLSLPVICTALGLFNLIISSDFLWLKKMKMSEQLIKLIEWLAGISLGIYVIHALVVDSLTYLGFNYNVHPMNAYLYNAINVVLVLGISIFLSYIVKKTPVVKKLIGE